MDTFGRVTVVYLSLITWFSVQSGIFGVQSTHGLVVFATHPVAFKFTLKHFTVSENASAFERVIISKSSFKQRTIRVNNLANSIYKIMLVMSKWDNAYLLSVYFWRIGLYICSHPPWYWCHTCLWICFCQLYGLWPIYSSCSGLILYKLL